MSNFRKVESTDQYGNPCIEVRFTATVKSISSVAKSYVNALGEEKFYRVATIDLIYPKGKPAVGILASIPETSFIKGIKIGFKYLAIMNRDEQGRFFINVSHIQEETATTPRVYITNGTIKSLIHKVEYDEEVVDNIIEKITNKLFYVLNKKEKKDLFYFYQMCAFDNEKLLRLEYVEKQEDTKQYFHDDGRGKKYHLFEDCEYLKKSFEAVQIPIDFKEYALANDENLIDELREWWIEENCMDKINEGREDVVMFKYNTKFASKFNLKKLTNLNELYVSYDNTGITGLETGFSKDGILNEIRVRIDKIPVRNFERIFKNLYKLEKNDSSFEKFLKELNHNGDEKVFWKILNFKNDIIKLVRQYIFLEYNVIDCFDREILESFGLELCLKCEQEELKKNLE